MSDTPTTDQAPAVEETFPRSYVEQLRAEAARYRVEKNTAVDEAKAQLTAEYDAKIAEKDTAYAELNQKLTDVSVELRKFREAVAAGVPSQLLTKVVSLVHGDSEADIKASVETVMSLIGSDSAGVPQHDRPVDHSQGSGNAIPLNGDPIVNLLKAAIRA